jgi:hypothetical protein
MGYRLGMELLESDEQLSFASIPGALVVVAHGRELPSSFTLARRHIERVHEEHGAPIGVLMVVDHDQGPPERYKENAQALLARTREKLAGVSVAIMSKGFVAAVYRSVGTVMLSVAGERNFVSLHGGVADAATWLAPRLTGGGSERALEEAVAHLRRNRSAVTFDPDAQA